MVEFGDATDWPGGDAANARPQTLRGLTPALGGSETRVEVSPERAETVWSTECVPMSIGSPFYTNTHTMGAGYFNFCSFLYAHSRASQTCSGYPFGPGCTPIQPALAYWIATSASASLRRR